MPRRIRWEGGATSEELQQPIGFFIESESSAYISFEKVVFVRTRAFFAGGKGGDFF